MSGIYVASKTKHADLWKRLRSFGYPIVSTWIDEAGAGETSDWSDLWVRCVNEAKSASALIVYAEDGDTLKGALVEVGAALANGVPVYSVGISGMSWLNHPLAVWCESLEAALNLVKKYCI